MKKIHSLSYIILLTVLILSLFIGTLQFTKESFEEESSHEYKLCILSQFKNETMTMKTWLEHYINQGIEQFYLIDNASDDNPLDILQPYIDAGLVKYFYKPEKHAQLKNYKNMIETENLKEKTKWLIICDLDEFYYCPETKLIDIIDSYSDDINIHHIDNIENAIFENDKIRLNHYPLQSLEFYTKVKMTRGDVASQEYENVRDMKYFEEYNKDMIFKDETLANMQYNN